MSIRWHIDTHQPRKGKDGSVGQNILDQKGISAEDVYEECPGALVAFVPHKGNFSAYADYPIIV